MTPPTPQGREADEYRSLRDTIRERGSARVWLLWAGLCLWAVMVLALLAVGPIPIATLLPLFVLGVTFESAFAIHTAVERIGRYLQVFHESDGEGWEHQAMAFGRQFAGGEPAGAPGGRIDPLLSLWFLVAAMLNVIPAIVSRAVLVESAVIGAAHLLFVVRLVQARRLAATQRARDLERFQQLRGPRP